jgi:hypothetical protein
MVGELDSYALRLIDFFFFVGRLMWPLLELFANMDMAQLSSLVSDDVLGVFRAQPWNNASEIPGELSCGSFVWFGFCPVLELRLSLSQTF